ncbi:hypothetical protein VTK56DRAFT_10101 [Thermocarpiscus australiensis]
MSRLTAMQACLPDMGATQPNVRGWATSYLTGSARCPPTWDLEPEQTQLSLSSINTAALSLQRKCLQSYNCGIVAVGLPTGCGAIYWPPCGQASRKVAARQLLWRCSEQLQSEPRQHCLAWLPVLACRELFARHRQVAWEERLCRSRLHWWRGYLIMSLLSRNIDTAKGCPLALQQVMQQLL